MLKVVIVEDEPILLKGLLYRVDWFKNDCVVVGTAESGEEGCQLIRDTQPHIVITDIRMPFKDGVEMLQETKSSYHYEAIILSGYSEFAYAQQAIRLGVHNYMLKPVDLGELEQSIRELVTRIHEKHQMNQSQTALHVLHLKTEWEQPATYTAAAISYIKEHYHQKVTLAMVSESIGLSTVSINAKIKQVTGYSFNELLTRYRLLKAVEKLQNETSLIYEVAEQTGFSDYKYFSQVFKKYVGQSPKQFMQEGEVDTFN